MFLFLISGRVIKIENKKKFDPAGLKNSRVKKKKKITGRPGVEKNKNKKREATGRVVTILERKNGASGQCFFIFLLKKVFLHNFKTVLMLEMYN